MGDDLLLLICIVGSQVQQERCHSSKTFIREQSTYHVPPDTKTPFLVTQPRCHFSHRELGENHKDNHNVLAPSAQMCESRLFVLKWTVLSSVDMIHPGTKLQHYSDVWIGLVLPFSIKGLQAPASLLAKDRWDNSLLSWMTYLFLPFQEWENH